MSKRIVIKDDPQQNVKDTESGNVSDNSIDSCLDQLQKGLTIRREHLYKSVPHSNRKMESKYMRIHKLPINHQKMALWCVKH